MLKKANVQKKWLQSVLKISINLQFSVAKQLAQKLIWLKLQKNKKKKNL